MADVEINVMEIDTSPMPSPMQISGNRGKPTGGPLEKKDTATHLEVPTARLGCAACDSNPSSRSTSPRKPKSSAHRRQNSKSKSPNELQLKKVLKLAKQKAVDDYEFGKTLGEGRYGKVKMGHHTKTGKKVAVKILTKSNIKSEEDLLRIQRETKILTSLHHDNIIRVYDVYETPLQIYIVMEFAEGGDLYTHLVTQRTSALPLEEALPYFRQIVSAMLYCHARFVVHRDLKPENLLLDRSGKSLKIADFGFSRTFSPEFDGLQTSCGSLYYAAPEILEGKKYIGPEVDVWSLGVILFVMLTGEMPFEGGNDHELAKNIKRGNVRQQPLLSCDPVHGPTLSKLVNSMLTVDPKKRAKLADIQLHPTAWLDKPLLASLVLPFARKLAYTKKQSMLVGQCEHHLQTNLVTPLSQLRTNKPTSSSPALKRSFSATIGPSPFIARENPPAVTDPVPIQAVAHTAGGLKGAAGRRKLLRQTSGPLASAEKMMIRTSGGGIPIPVNQPATTAPNYEKAGLSQIPPPLTQAAVAATRTAPTNGEDHGNGVVGESQQTQPQPQPQLLQQQLLQLQQTQQRQPKKRSPLRTATAGFTLPADSIDVDSSVLPPRTSSTASKGLRISDPLSYHRPQVPELTTTTATPPPQTFHREETKPGIQTSPETPVSSRNEQDGTDPTDATQTTSQGFVDRLHLEKLKEFLPDFGFITRKRSSTIS